MKSLRHSLFMACIFFGSVLPNLGSTKEELTPATFEWRLQQLSLESQEERLHHLFDLYWELRMVDNPMEATFCGYPGQNHRWPDLSPKSIESHLHLTEQLLDTLTHISSLDLAEEDKISYEVLKRNLEEELQDASYQSHYLMIDQMNGIHLFIPLVISLMPTNTVHDYEDILARLYGTKDLINQSILLLEKGLELGITPPKITLSNVPKQILNQIYSNPLDSPLLESFCRLPNSISEEEQKRLIEEAKDAYLHHVVPALYKLYSYMTEHYIPNSRKTIAFGDLPKGKEWYAWKAYSNTTTTLSPHEIHTIGMKEVSRIHQEMLALKESVNFVGSFSDFLHFLKTDPQFFYSDQQSLLDGYQQLTKYIEKQLGKLFIKLPKQPFEVLPIPEYTAESQVAAYYCGGSSDQRPGYFFINTSFPEKRPKWEMEPLALHEAVPGHHLQIALAQEMEELPDFRKHAGYTAYIEGWGLYAESLGKELGLYRDPYSQFGRLAYEMLRAIRLVVDTGMHSMGWSRQEAIDFFKQYVCMSEHEIVTEVDRYLVYPGQALAYKIGELKIQELRHKAHQILGSSFDIRSFHHEWLRHGALPLEISEQLINQWINQQLQLSKSLENRCETKNYLTQEI